MPDCGIFSARINITYFFFIAINTNPSIDAMYNYRQGEIHSAEFSDEFNKLCIPFEDSLSEEQIDVFHRILDCVSETAAAEMRAAYKVGFKDGAKLISEIKA